MSAIKKFWLSLFEMIEVLLNLFYATHSGQWHLYIETIRSVLPYFFAYDRQNYSRYLTTNYQELLLLKDNHPEIYAEFQNGNFSLHESESNSFPRMEMDKVIEITINKDTKTALKMYWFTSYQTDFLKCKICHVYLFSQNSLNQFPQNYVNSRWSMELELKTACCPCNK